MWCSADGCERNEAWLWNRNASEEELAWLKAQGEIRSSETSATLPVRACDECTIPENLRPYLHDAACTAPPVCNCSVAQEHGA